jgi:hypothetical protein
MEMGFNNMSDSDRIVIRTQNSEYQFSITDPAERRGVLSGGSLGTQQRDAVLVGTLGGTNQLSADVTGLKTGRRALFYLKAKHGVERLITSIITEIRRGPSYSGERHAA